MIFAFVIEITQQTYVSVYLSSTYQLNTIFFNR